MVIAKIKIAQHFQNGTHPTYLKEYNSSQEHLIQTGTFSACFFFQGALFIQFHPSNRGHTLPVGLLVIYSIRKYTQTGSIRNYPNTPLWVRISKMSRRVPVVAELGRRAGGSYHWGPK